MALAKWLEHVANHIALGKLPDRQRPYPIGSMVLVYMLTFNWGILMVSMAHHI